ncbi:MAG: S-methyl-5'-thioadenosine phosphorylase, partial [Thermoplasmata archaeon]
STLATITDYDVWAEKPVTAEEVVKIMKENEYKVKETLKKSVQEIDLLDGKNCEKILEESGI